MALPPRSGTHLANTLISSSRSGPCSDTDTCVDSTTSDTLPASVGPAPSFARACGIWSMAHHYGSLCVDDEDLDAKLECRMESPIWPDTDEDYNTCEIGIGTAVSDSWPVTGRMPEDHVDHQPVIQAKPFDGAVTPLASLLQAESSHASTPVLCDILVQGSATEAAPSCADPLTTGPNISVLGLAVQTQDCEDTSTSVRDAMIAKASAAAAAAMQNLSNAEPRYKSRALAKRSLRSNASQPTSEATDETSEAALAVAPAESLHNVSDEDFTTVMIRNLPKGITQQQLLQEMDVSGFAGLYDFCYMPCGAFKTATMSGFAFANFMSPEATISFYNEWNQSYRFDMGPLDQTLNVCPAKVQGKNANLLRCESGRMRRIRNPKFQPFVLEGHTRQGADASPQPVQ